MATLKLNPEVQVATVVAEYPATKALFEAFGVDFCCGGKRMLAEAAAEANMPVEVLIRALDVVIHQAKANPVVERDWQEAPLEELIDHIIREHHVRLVRELPLLTKTLQKVGQAHGAKHGKVLQPLADTFAGLREELEAHLNKEEEIIFPMIRRLVNGICDKDFTRKIAELEHEHTGAGEALGKMHAITDDYALPPDACTTYAGLYDGLQALERDLHQHIHLENNILFPRALYLARSCGEQAA